MPRLVVVAGPANSGKLAVMWAIAARDPSLHTLHRDQIRLIPGRLIDEAHLTMLMDAMAGCLLKLGHSVITVSQNQAPGDFGLWHYTAMRTGADLEWIDTAEVDVGELVRAA